MFHVRYARHRDLNWNGDLLLYFLGSPAWPLCDHLYIVVGDVGISLDGQVAERKNAPGEHQDGAAKYQPSAPECKINERTNHLLFHRAVQRQRIADDLLADADACDDHLLICRQEFPRSYCHTPESLVT